MKSLIVLAVILSSSDANANIVVGDMVKYNLKISNPAYEQLIDVKSEVIAINTQAGAYSTKVTQSMDGVITSQSTESNDLNSANESENVLDHCLEMPADMASIETITVPAGTFITCHIKLEQNGVKIDQFMGKVLFGLVKSEALDSSTNTTSTYELVEVKKN